MAADEIEYPSGFGMSDVLAWGTTGLVVLDEASNTVIKTPLDSDQRRIDLILKEQQIYERFTGYGGHVGILSYHGAFESGIRLEYAPNHNLHWYTQKHDVDFGQRLCWAVRISEAINFIHKLGVVHGDLTCSNILLDKSLNAKLADFAGSSIDDSPLLIAVTASHEYPGPLLSVQGDLFAFGSVLYEVMTGQAPYNGLTDEEIRIRYSRGDFPSTEFLKGIGSVIKKCWQGRYRECEMVIKDIRGPFQFFSNSESQVTDH